MEILFIENNKKMIYYKSDILKEDKFGRMHKLFRRGILWTIR
jgi:hypothetical protein